MKECRVLFLNAARWKKLENELRCFSQSTSAATSTATSEVTRPPRKSAKVIDLDEARAAARPLPDDCAQ